MHTSGVVCDRLHTWKLHDNRAVLRSRDSEVGVLVFARHGFSRLDHPAPLEQRQFRALPAQIESAGKQRFDFQVRFAAATLFLRARPAQRSLAL
jgi:hypothetical protein